MDSVMRIPILRLCLPLWVISVLGCATSIPAPEQNPDLNDAAAIVRSAVPETLHIADEPFLPAPDINVAIFDVGPDAGETAAYMAVRKLESRLLPGLLREALVSSAQWGAVRVVPTVSPLAPVNIRATIVASDGRDLILDVRVSDITGAEWLALRLAYRETAPSDNLSDLSRIFHVVSNRMRDYWLSRTEVQRSSVISIADMLYARSLAPDVFSDYVDNTGPMLSLKRMPASNDPMLSRVKRIRNQEYLFCDAVDEQLGMLLERAGPTYYLWRQASIEQANWLDQYESMAASRSAGKGGGEFSRMQASYSAYRSYRTQEQALFELAEALDGESEPVVMTTEGARTWTRTPWIGTVPEKSSDSTSTRSRARCWTRRE